MYRFSLCKTQEINIILAPTETLNTTSTHDIHLEQSLQHHNVYIMDKKFGDIMVCRCGLNFFSFFVARNSMLATLAALVKPEFCIPLYLQQLVYKPYTKWAYLFHIFWNIKTSPKCLSKNEENMH